MKLGPELMKTIKLDIENNITPFLAGEPGIGKSSIVYQLGDELGGKTFSVSCNQLADKSDLTGVHLMPYTKPDGTSSYTQQFFPHDDVTRAIEYAQANPNTIVPLLLDEINRSNSDVTSAALTMISERRLGREPFPKNLRLIAAGNIRGNIVALDSASLTRFSVYNVVPDAHVLLDYLGDTCNEYVRAVLTESPELVYCKATPQGVVSPDHDDDDDDSRQVSIDDINDAAEEMTQITTPRTIENTSRWLNSIDNADLRSLFSTSAENPSRPQQTVLHELLEAHAGDTKFTTQLIGKIAEGLTKNTSSSSNRAKGIARPTPYTQIAACTSATDLDTVIANLSDHEKSACLLYAIYEPRENSVIVTKLAEALPMMERDDIGKLAQIAPSGQLDRGNVQTLIDSGTPIAASLGTVLDLAL